MNDYDFHLKDPIIAFNLHTHTHTHSLSHTNTKTHALFPEKVNLSKTVPLFNIQLNKYDLFYS